MGELFAPAHVLIILVAAVFWGLMLIVPFWQIFKKAGMSPALSFLMIVPIINVVMLYVLAYTPWNPVSSRSTAVADYPTTGRS